MGRTAPATKAFFLRMPGRSAANRMRQCANAKTVTTSFVRVYPLVALQCGPAPNRYRCVTRRQLTRYAMPWRQQASRPIQCTSCTGSMPLRGVLRPRRLPERNRHAGDFWRPNACFDDRVRAGRAGVVAQASCQRCVSHSSCSGPVVGCQCERACTARTELGVGQLPGSFHIFNEKPAIPAKAEILNY